jgi:hydrogenase maturation protease
MRSGGDPRPLVIGYGNVLRTDDGIGWRVAERLAQDPRLDGVTVLQRHQLTPELALDVSRASLVAFVDAGVGGAPGSVVIEPVARFAPGTTAWTHRFDPSTLVALAGTLYGTAPDAYAVRVAAGSLEAGDTLTPALDHALPQVVDAVADLVATHDPAQLRTGP